MKKLAVYFSLFVLMHVLTTYGAAIMATFSLVETVRAEKTELPVEGKIYKNIAKVLSTPMKAFINEENEKNITVFIGLLLVNSILWGLVVFGTYLGVTKYREKAT